MALHPAHYSTTSVATVALLFATPGLAQDSERMDEVVSVQADNGTCALSPSLKISMLLEGDKLVARRRRPGNPRSSCSRRRGRKTPSSARS